MHATQDLAVKSALSGDWESAVELNLEILADNPTSIAALNRLGRAYTELGQKEAAQDAYTRVLKIDKYDAIATKNLKLLPHQRGSTTSATLASEEFIELPGLTKSSPLIKLASRDILLSLVCKQQLYLTPRARLVSVTTQTGTAIGCLPDDLSARIQRYLKSGYLYSACLKGASDNSATIFIRELKRPKRPSATPTFARAHADQNSK